MQYLFKYTEVLKLKFFKPQNYPYKNEEFNKYSFQKWFTANDFKSAAILARNFTTLLNQNINNKYDGGVFTVENTVRGQMIKQRLLVGITDFEMTT